MKRNKFLQGIIKRHPDGFGFFIPENPEHPDVYIPKHSMQSVMTNDHVMIEVFPERGGNRFRGEIIRVVKRGTHKVVGVFSILNDKFGLIRDEGKGWGQDLRIPLDKSLSAKSGELVSAEISDYPDSDKGFEGKVVEVIGNALDPLTDVKRVLLGHHIPHEFPANVEKESQRFTEEVSPKDFEGRKDLRHLNLITIDGATAKDFDDAIYVEQSNRGFVLYVAIADVSHYVRPGSAIDNEAYTRGTSVYFPNYVVPMLPEVLSNGLCSLNPHIPRLALVAEIHMDFTGEVFESHFYEAVIESKARVIYGEAQEVIDGAAVDKLKHVQADILRAADLAKILMAKRFKEGSLDLEIPETQVLLDGDGIPTDMIRSERLFAHRLIEELMLAANVAVAKFLHSKNIAALYRIHEPPNEEAIRMLERYLRSFGGRIDLDKGKLQKRITKALQEFEGKPESQILNILTLRSMSQAKYSSNNVGHFGLGFEFYTHFTSPIRRYPDLIVHRLIKNQVVRGGGYRLMGEDELATAGTMLSACEQRSVKAERQFVSIKKARFLEKHIGEEFEGVISSVTKFGVFVLLRAFEVDGLIRLESLAKEKLEFNEDLLALVGRRSGVKFMIGDLLKIKVTNADPELGQVDFDLVEVLESVRSISAPQMPPTHKSASHKSSRHKSDSQKHRSQKHPSYKSAHAKENRKDNNNKKSNKEHPSERSKKLQAADKVVSKTAGKDRVDELMDKWKKRNPHLSGKKKSAPKRNRRR